MKSTPAARTSSKKTKRVADARRVRFGAGMAPARVVRAEDPATRDERKVRFGAGMISATLRRA